MKNVIVTGGTGFLGRNLIRRLCSDGMTVYAIVRPDSRNLKLLPAYPSVIPVFCDIGEIEQEKGKLPKDGVAFFHFAWRGVNREELNDEGIQERNVSDSLRALRVAAELGCRSFLFAGSRSEYGKQEGYYREDLDGRPQVAYGRAKFRFYEKAAAFCDGLEIQYIHPRIFSVYGPDDHPWSLICSSVTKMLRNEPMDLSACTQRWNFVEIRDAVDLIVTMVRERDRIPEGDSGIFNVANQDIRPLRTFVEEIYALTGSRSVLNFGAFHQAEESALSLLPDMSKVEKVFGWSHQVSFRDGIQRMIGELERKHA